MRAIKAKRGIRAAREFANMLAAHAKDQFAVEAVTVHYLWPEHCNREFGRSYSANRDRAQ